MEWHISQENYQGVLKYEAILEWNMFNIKNTSYKTVWMRRLLRTNPVRITKIVAPV